MAPNPIILRYHFGNFVHCCLLGTGCRSSVRESADWSTFVSLFVVYSCSWRLAICSTCSTCLSGSVTTLQETACLTGPCCGHTFIPSPYSVDTPPTSNHTRRSATVALHARSSHGLKLNWFLTGYLYVSTEVFLSHIAGTYLTYGGVVFLCDREPVWNVGDSCGPKEPCIYWGPNSQWEAKLEVCPAR